MLFPLSGDVVSIHLGFKKMRIFKNKIIFFLVICWNGIQRLSSLKTYFFEFTLYLLL